MSHVTQELKIFIDLNFTYENPEKVDFFEIIFYDFWIRQIYVFKVIKMNYI